MKLKYLSILVPIATLCAMPIVLAAPPEPIDPGESGIENLYRVTESVISGSEPHGDAGFEALALRGVKTIISADGMRPDIDAARKHGIEYVHIPIGYDAIPAEASAALSKTLQTRPGPFYIHCHHGKHRGPALGAIALRLQTQCDDETVLKWLERAGVGAEYEGLWKDAVAFQPESIRGMNPELYEAMELGGIIDAMAAASRTWDRLKECEKAGWNAPPGHSDVSPPHEAVILNEHFVEMARQEYEGYTDAEFTKSLAHAVELTTRLSTALADGERQAASKAYALIGKSCKDCHHDWRN